MTKDQKNNRIEVASRVEKKVIFKGRRGQNRQRVSVRDEGKSRLARRGASHSCGKTLFILRGKKRKKEEKEEKTNG